MWDHGEFGDTALGEIMYNLQPLFHKARRERKDTTSQVLCLVASLWVGTIQILISIGTVAQERRWLSFSHPDYRDMDLGQLNVEFTLVTQLVADREPGSSPLGAGLCFCSTRCVSF